ncbi:MAG: hypothetical protein SFU83_14980 [Meiothermus sp.]|nr:hypothetical protein [Meiothermus sp.]
MTFRDWYTANHMQGEAVVIEHPTLTMWADSATGIIYAADAHISDSRVSPDWYAPCGGQFVICPHWELHRLQPYSPTFRRVYAEYIDAHSR